MSSSKNGTVNALKETYKRIFLPLAAAVISTGVLVLCVLTLFEVNNNGYETAPRYLVWVFILLGLSNLITFLKEKTKMNLIKCLVLLAFDVALGIVILFGGKNPYLFSLVAGLYCVGLVAGRIIRMIQKRNLHSYIVNGLLIAVLVLLAYVLLTPIQNIEEQIGSVILAECVIIAIASFLQVFAVAISQLKLNVLGRIILKTYALEILFGMAAMIVCFALVFTYVEPNILNFGDGLWYCFAVVTTIGFGDYTCTTVVGRILSVILGLYGLVVVAVITSIFVNFYNETSGKNDKKEIDGIKKDIEKEEKNKRK